MSRSKAWGDLGDLKRELPDLWTEERNTLAKQVMQDIEAQRRKAKGRYTETAPGRRNNGRQTAIQLGCRRPLAAGL